MKKLETRNPLLQYSLTGLGQSLADKTAAQKPLLGNLCMQGEVSVWYALPNSGKTLIALALLLEAVSKKDIKPGDAYFINADDTSQGLAEKTVMLDDLGIHCLSPGQRGFTSGALLPALGELTSNGDAAGKLIILDTFKKFADPMSKRNCREFGDLMRGFCLAGGTVLALSHTNKSRGANGKLIYGGTSDLMEDADSAYMLECPDMPAKAKERLVIFENSKRRGPNVERAEYTYSSDPELSYVQRLVSVAAAETEYGPDHPPPRLSADEDIILTIHNGIRAGTTKKMALVAAVSKTSGESKAAVMKILDRNCGDDPELHQWFVQKGNQHNAYHYHSHNPTLPQEQSESQAD